LLEALGCGNAVIAHNNVFNREVADNAALYFSTATEIPNLVEKIDTDETLRAAMRLNARNIVSQRYTWKLVTDAYMALLTAPSSTEW
ncbi:MAG TPA: glycosyltransferase, partial [Nitrosomonas sp.]|nr:glycosyltransferase [Nitrosomonas sp.]